jgi:ankyrin repeat protein
MIQDDPKRNAQSMLFDAVDRNDMEGVMLAILSGANVNESNCVSYETPLMTAAQSCNLGMIEMLVRHGADVNGSGIDGSLVLVNVMVNVIDFALQAGSRNVGMSGVWKLLELGADPTRSDAHGKSAISVSVEFGFSELSRELHRRKVAP